VGIQGGRVENAARHGINRSPDPLDVYIGISLMGVDNVEPAPVPQLHVDLAGAILMVARDYQASADSRKVGGEIERPLRSNCLDHPLGPLAAGQLLHLADDLVVVVQRHGDIGAQLQRQLEGKGPPGNGDHPRTCSSCQPGEQRAEEADPDNDDGLPRLNVRAPENVHSTAEWLPWEKPAGEIFGEWHDSICCSDVVLGIGPIGKRGYTIAHLNSGHLGADGIHHSPAFMPWASRLRRVLEPGTPFPERQA
jgi:hypothetical protein